MFELWIIKLEGIILYTTPSKIDHSNDLHKIFVLRNRIFSECKMFRKLLKFYILSVMAW